MNFKRHSFTRCCNILSRRIILISWGSLKLIINIGLLLIFFVYLMQGTSLVKHNGLATPSLRDTFTSVSVLLSTVIIDTAQHALLIAGTFYRSTKLLRDYYKFTIIWSILIAIAGVILTSIYIHDLTTPKIYSAYLCMLLLEITAFISYLGLQVYIVVLTRSEIKAISTARLTVFDNSVSSLSQALPEYRE